MRPLSHRWRTCTIRGRQHTTENKHYLHTSLSPHPRRVGAISLHLSGGPALADAAQQSPALAEAGQRRWSAPSPPTRQPSRESGPTLAGSAAPLVSPGPVMYPGPAGRPAASSQAGRPQHIHVPAGCHYKNTCSFRVGQADPGPVHSCRNARTAR